MAKLSEVLSNLTEKENVQILLKSFTKYGENGEFTMQDGVGNHFQCNWVEALKNTHLDFEVDTITFKHIWDTLQWTITLNANKSKETEKLAYVSNECAIMYSYRN